MGLQPKHRGRIQAQGSKLEESFAWAQDTPITAKDALAGLDSLEASLSNKDRKLRKGEFDKARKFIQSAEKGGGVDAQVSKTFLVKGTAHERVDIEVTSGKAFVPDSSSLSRKC
ncbi:hypothetical protein C5471_22935 [Photorhabdus tasmaniensis]|uniref:Uncharacterized protein n=1 Tax=Photorhabdus tasmaniensis TaxID=1004159 RepID=A0ABX0GQH2_9GAMM|nr:hypothetical protein [Photorhabdus tasmaniensis]